MIRIKKIGVSLHACLLAGLSLLTPAFADTDPAVRSGETIKPISVYKKNDLLDISADGRLLLFYQTSTPIRSFTIPLGGGKGQADQPETYDDVLRVVERESGKEVGRLPVRPFAWGRFVPGARQVFYLEDKPYPQRGGCTSCGISPPARRRSASTTRRAASGG